MLIVDFIQRLEGMPGVLSGPESALMTDALMASPTVDCETLGFVDGARVPAGRGRGFPGDGRVARVKLQRV